MKPLDCDQVFDVLTRGPFPTGDAIDRHVERHLLACHDCRALAEALRPAVELFHEAIDAEDSRDLPGYHGALAPARGGLAQMVAQAIERDTEQPPAPVVMLPAHPWWQELLGHAPLRFAAAAALGAVLALGIWGAEMFATYSAPTGVRPPTLAAASPQPADLRQLAALDLKPVCFTQPASPLAANQLRCCTECHTARQSPAPVASLSLIASSCKSCHH